MQVTYRIVLTGLVLGMIIASCGRKPLHVTNVETEMIAVDSTLNAIQDTAYLTALAPKKAYIEERCSEVLGVMSEPMSAYTPESPLSNWAADALLYPVRANRPDEADFSVVNMGGLRCNWPAGELTVRHLFELMPFENEVVILTLSGDKVLELANQMAAAGGQGVSGMTFEIADGLAQNVRVQGKPVNPEASYHVVTSDYLSNGADGMDALAEYSAREFVGIKLRDQYIDYAKTQTANGQPIAAKCDGRVKVIK